MRRIILLIIFILMFIQLPALATDNYKLVAKSYPLIKDELLTHKKFNNMKPYIKEEKGIITDELLDDDVVNGDIFNIHIYKNDRIDEKITDELLNSPTFKDDIIESEITKQSEPEKDFILNVINPNKVRKIKPKNIYNFAKKQIAVNVKVAEKINFKNNINEGDDILFEATHDFSIKNIKFAKGTIIIGRVETISKSDRMGVPESVRIDNFYIDKYPEINLSGFVSKHGANRAIWVYPLYQAGNITLYVAGFVFVPIHGGHAKLHPKETFTLFYETP